MRQRGDIIKYITLPRRDGWLVTLTDVTYLLITFFVLLLSMASMDKKTFQDYFGVFSHGIGVLDFPSGKDPRSMKTMTEANMLKMVDVNSMTEALKQKIEDGTIRIKSPPGDVYEIRQTSRGVTIGLKSDVLFDSGSATLRKEVVPVLAAIGNVLNKTDNPISVEGYSDNIGTIDSNLTLSRKRAQAVLDFFVYEADVSPTRFSLSAYGPFAPRVPNNSELQRMRNRRVDILLLKQIF